MLVDNGCSLYIFDSTLKDILDKHVEGDLAENQTDKAKLQVNLDNLSSFNKNRKALNQIVKEHVKPKDQAMRLLSTAQAFKHVLRGMMRPLDEFINATAPNKATRRPTLDSHRVGIEPSNTRASI